MQKILLALALAIGTLSAAAPTYAAVPHHRHHHHRGRRHQHHYNHYRHHPVCHSWREHGHWVRRCR